MNDQEQGSRYLRGKSANIYEEIRKLYERLNAEIGCAAKEEDHANDLPNGKDESPQVGWGGGCGADGEVQGQGKPYNCGYLKAQSKHMPPSLWTTPGRTPQKRRVQAMLDTCQHKNCCVLLIAHRLVADQGRDCGRRRPRQRR